MLDHEELVSTFVEEARNHLQLMEPIILEMQTGGPAADSLEALIQSARSINRSAGFFDLHAMRKLSSAMEEALVRLQNDRIAPPPALGNALINGLAALKAMFVDIRAGDAVDIDDEVSALRNAFDAAGPQPTGSDVMATEKSKAAPTGRDEDKIRVSVSFLNDLANLAGELVLGRNQLMQTALPLVKATPGLNPVLQHISRVTSEMQEKIMRLRMQPMSVLFSRFHRVVRSLARDRNKEVRLTTSGDDVELDKSVLQALVDPLTILIRNFVHSGIEPPGDRERKGKPRSGTIRLDAAHQDGHVRLRVSDDGGGDANSRTGSADMDMVRVAVEGLGGKVGAEARQKTGAAVTLDLPLTLSIVSGLLIGAGRQFFILPEADVDELVRIKPEHVTDRIDIVQNAWTLRLRDRLLPLVNLNDALNISEENGAGADPEDRLGGYAAGGKALRVLVITHAGFRFGLLTDDIVGSEEIVVKPLPRFLKQMACFSGVSILGNGNIALILDVGGLLKKADIRRLEQAVEKEIETPGDGAGRQAEQSDVQTLLLFDNNTPEQYAFPLELISRIERISMSDIEKIKDKHFLQYQNKKLKLVFLESYLPVAAPERSEADQVSVLIPKHARYPLGIVFNKVINTVETAVELDAETIKAPGLFGSAIVDGRITLMPDMYRLFEMAAPEWHAEQKDKQTKQQRKRRVLLAEDTPFFRMVESKYLTSAGYEALQAENGLRAMEILEEETVDAVILDIIMPKMDGWETLAAIRSDDRLKRLPVMAVTSLGVAGDQSVIQKGLKAGFDEWELKLDKARLLEKLAAMIQRRSKEASA